MSDPIHVLHIDDDTEFLELTATFLERENDRVEMYSRSAADEGLELLRTEPIDCIISDYAMPRTDGLELLEAVRERDPDIPFIMYTGQGSEGVASQAISAGVTDYVQKPNDTDDYAVLANRIERAVEAYHAETRAERLAQINAVIRDVSETAVRATEREGLLETACQRLADSAMYTGAWIGDPETNAEGIDRKACTGIEEPLLAGIGPPDTTGTGEQNPAKSAFRTNEPTVFQQSSVDPGDEMSTSSSSPTTGVAVPITYETTRYAVLVVYADQPNAFTESEQRILTEVGETIGHAIHRIETHERLEEETTKYSTLVENSTDGIVILTDGVFEFANEQMATILGTTIDELHGQSFTEYIDPADRGVITDHINRTDTETERSQRHEITLDDGETIVEFNGANIEYRGTDAIMGVVRDITERKSYEKTLTTLHQTTRELLHIDTVDELGTVVTEAAADVLGVSLVGLYQFENEANILRPVATTTAGQIPSELPSVSPGGNALWTVFTSDERAVLNDEESLPAWMADRLTSALVVPIGNHGLLLAGATPTESITDQTIDVADIVTSTTAAAFDRIERDANLRAREQRLEDQNAQLTRVNQLNEQLRRISRLLVQSQSREEIERDVCESLTEIDRFGFAWIGSPDFATGQLQPQSWAGDDGRYLDAISLAIESEDVDPPPAVRAAATREVAVVSNIGDKLHDAPWRQEALTHGYQSVMSVPLVYNDILYDVLTVYGTEQAAFDAVNEAVLADFGQAIAMAINSIERRDALLSDQRVRVEFDLADQNCLFYQLTRTIDCSLELREVIHRSEDSTVVFVELTDGDPEAVATAAEELTIVEESRLITNSQSDALLQLEVTAPFLATVVAEYGGSLEQFVATDTEVRAAIELPASADVRAVIDVLADRYPDVSLRSKQQFSRTSTRQEPDGSQLLDQLTERQRETIEIAYNAGFFEWPRETTGEEVADTIGVSPPTFHRHLRQVEQKLFADLLEEPPRTRSE